MAKEIGIIVGSLREGSLNRLVAKTFESILPKEYEATWIEIGDLPLYNEDLDQGETPAEWQRLRDTVQNVAGVISLLLNIIVRYQRL